MQLTERQLRILQAVVDEYQRTGRPVGSKTLVERSIVDASASTVRYELGRLEQAGLLEAPHTSAGRVPTDAGYRAYVDLVASAGGGGARMALAAATGAGDAVALRDEGALGSQIDEALRVTTQALAEMTQLLAVVTAPRPSGAVIRHVEVLQLQPTMLVVVIITAAGDVTRHVIATGSPVDPGLVDWCGEYLNEQVTGMTIGQNVLRARLRPSGSDLGAGERAMLALVEPAFLDLAVDTQDVLVGGSAGLIGALGDDVQRVAGLVAILDERRRLLSALRPLVDEQGTLRQHAGVRGSRVVVRIGSENQLPELQRLSVVGAAYGRGTRPLGIVGVIGPRSMDYPRAMLAVHGFADALGQIADELYE